MKIFILAGGKGTRLWPLSTSKFPKQFLKFGDKYSFLQKTILRNLKIVSENDLFFLTTESCESALVSQVREISPRLVENIVLEPVGRNTAPSVALGIKYALDVLKVSEDEVCFICPADHLISPDDQFVNAVKKAENLARQNYIIIFGAIPNKPETGYGYIKKNSSSPIDIGFLVEEFKEKPDLATAMEYLKSKQYLWNTGMLAFTIKSMQEAIKLHAPEINHILSGTYESFYLNFFALPNISIDYAILEKIRNTLVLPFNMKWSDIGSWDSFYEEYSKDDSQSIKIGDINDINSKESLIIQTGHLSLGTIGMERMIVVATDSAILIAKRGESEKVKQLVTELLQKEKDKNSNPLATIKPWGNYTVLRDEPGHKVKSLVVNPGGKLSLQMHYYRDEHWVVVRGTANVVKNNSEIILHENESIFIPKLTHHRIENKENELLEIIEVQTGDYLEEDDIVRLEDIYGRTEQKEKTI